MNKIIHGDSAQELKKLESDSVDLIVTDPPYGYSFMGKDWDKAVPCVGIWKECMRVLKPGGFAFVMSAPRQDVLSQMIVRITEAGFDTDFTSIYWTYASGFPKAMNIGKAVDKRNGRSQDNPEFRQYLKNAIHRAGKTMKECNFELGTQMMSHYTGDSQPTLPTVKHWKKLRAFLRTIDDRYDELIEREEAEREVVGKKSYTIPTEVYQVGEDKDGTRSESLITAPSTDEAKALDGSYAGFQPKPAVEIIIVAMKPLSEKTYVDQALKNGKGITWLDGARIPTDNKSHFPTGTVSETESVYGGGVGRYGSSARTDDHYPNGRFPANLLVSDDVLNDHSRYFNLDAWADTHPFIAVPKASKGEKNRGCEKMPDSESIYQNGTGYSSSKLPFKNAHPTVKPLKLMAYLITLGSREGDVVLDPFAGSGTTCLAAKELGRSYIGIELTEEYIPIIEARLSTIQTLFT